jgi:hypothetical protein
VRQYLQDYQQHVASIAQDPAAAVDTAAAVDAAAAAKADAHAEATAQQMDTAEEHTHDTAPPVVHATPAATVAGATPSRRPFGPLHANTQAAAATTVYAVKVSLKPVQGTGKGPEFDSIPGHPIDSSNCGNIENTTGPYGGALLAGTQPEQAASLVARTSRRSTRSKAGVGAAAAAAAAAAGFAAVPGHVGHVGLFGAAAAISSPAPGLAGATPTRLMR